MTTCSRRATFALALGMGALAVGRADAAAIVSDLSTPTSQFNNFSFSNTSPIAVPFTLSVSDTASSAIVQMQAAFSLAPSLSDLSAEILSDNGLAGSSAAPGSTVYATGDGGTGTYSTSSANPITFAFSSASLMTPGNYWLEFLVSVPNVNVSISYSTVTLSNTGPEGDVGDLLYRGQQFTGRGGIVEIDNAVTPEPGTLGLLAVGAMAQLARRRRQSS